MTVYVDDMYKYPMGQFKRGNRTMKMSHMIATDEQELHALAQKIGVARRHYQRDHYDICMAMRETAIKFGAVPITLRQLACMNALRVRGHDMGDPATAVERRAALSK